MNAIGKSLTIARYLHGKNIPFLPKFIWIFNRIIFTCDISYKSQIHKTVTFSHNGLGVIINPNTIIDRKSLVLQNVTLGGNLGKKREINGRVTSAPVIGKNTIIGAGAIILGPVKNGDNARIGAGSVVTRDIPSNTVAVGAPAKPIKLLSKKEIQDTIL